MNEDTDRHAEEPSDPEKAGLTHLDAEGHARMVDVGGKDVTHRRAVASGSVTMSATALAAIRDGKVPKGDVMASARLAGIQAAKRTSELIPLCHPLSLTHVDVEITVDDANTCVRVKSRVEAVERTGVEMEALMAVSVAALTIYDMAKSLDRAMLIGDIGLEEKSGGRSGTYRREESPDA
jgi:cyclic pyranopterin phosphate synthase